MSIEQIVFSYPSIHARLSERRFKRAYVSRHIRYFCRVFRAIRQSPRPLCSERKLCAVQDRTRGLNANGKIKKVPYFRGLFFQKKIKVKPNVFSVLFTVFAILNVTGIVNGIYVFSSVFPYTSVKIYLCQPKQNNPEIDPGSTGALWKVEQQNN